MTNYFLKILAECIFVGLLVVIFGILVSFLISPLLKVDLPTECKKWNKNHVMELTLFFTGISFMNLFKKFLKSLKKLSFKILVKQTQHQFQTSTNQLSSWITLNLDSHPKDFL